MIKIAKFGQMKWFCAFIFLIFTGCYSTVYAQGNDLQLAQQYTLNGEPLKALDIYHVGFQPVTAKHLYPDFVFCKYNPRF